MRDSPRRTVASLSMTAALLAGCAATPPDSPVLDEAQTIYRQAALQPQVQRAAPGELEAARRALVRAQQAEGIAEINHHAYIAAQHARIATEIARRAAAEQEMEALANRRERIELEQTRAQLEQARKALAQTRAEMAALEAERDERGYVVTLGDLLFKPGSAQLLPSADEKLEKLADYLARHPDTQLLVEGYTDNVGDAAANRRLSEARARSVEQALASAGVDPARIGVRGYGQSNPVADNATIAGRQLNRRVELVVLEDASRPTREQVFVEPAGERGID